MKPDNRTLQKSEANFRVIPAENGAFYLEATAIVFNKRSVNLGWNDYKVFEIISPDACRGAKMDEIICKYNHDINKVLGTTWAGTLTFEITDTEVKYRVLLPDTETGREVKTLAERGDLKGNSFEFIPAKNGILWREEEENGEIVNIATVNQFEGIYDFAPVMRPAYRDTNGSITVSQRMVDSFNEFKAQRTNEQKVIPEPVAEEIAPITEEQPTEEVKVLRKLKYKID